MATNQILMAAARGARIQRNDGEGWLSTRLMPPEDLQMSVFDWRIHPEDDHYRFGPVSSVLREWAHETHVPLIGNYFERAAKEYLLSNLPAGMPPTVEQRQLFLLILSEQLAEDGL